MTDGPTTTLSLREVALRLRRRPPENPDTVIGALQAALARVRWWMRRRTYGGVERLTLGRPGHHGALLIVTLDPERVPGFADPSGKPLQVPVVRLGPGLHDGLRSLLPSEACSLDELPRLFRLLARAPEQTARRPWTASSKIPGGKDGEPDAARSTVPPPIVAPVPISGLALDPGSALARKIAMIRKVGHFAT